MNTQKISSKNEIVADLMQTPGGDLVIRPRPGRSLKLSRVADTIRQPDGSHRLTPHAEWIAMDQAMKILDMPYTTLRRAVESEAIAAYRKSPFRWAISLESVMELKRRTQIEPEFWEGFEQDNGAAAAKRAGIKSRVPKRKKTRTRSNCGLRRRIKPTKPN
jgi:hypothetical protein